jgi:hypothetical protein
MHAIALAHAAVGAVALLGFWIAALARKGGPLHRRAGTVYLWGMRAILVTALPLVLAYFLRGDLVRGIFFTHLLVLVGAAVILGQRAVRLKRDFPAYRGGLYTAVGWAQLASGLAAAGAGWWSGSPLLVVFGLVGAVRFAGIQHLRRAPATPAGWWLREHFMAMIANGVATHIAFLGIGLTRLLPQDLAAELAALNLAWFLPLAAGFGAIAVLLRRQRSRLAPRPAPLPLEG